MIRTCLFIGELTLINSVFGKIAKIRDGLTKARWTPKSAIFCAIARNSGVYASLIWLSRDIGTRFLMFYSIFDSIFIPYMDKIYIKLKLVVRSLK